MNQQQVNYRDQQRESWNKFSPGWKKWDDITMKFLQPMGDEIIRLLKLTGSETVLDVASGTGEPGLTIAELLPNGRVVITDLAEEMLTVANENIIRRGIKNAETRACDVCELPFNDGSFDAISCRFGFMFFPDMLLAAQEMVRVLRPGGRVATSVWSVPEKNFWITAIMGTLAKYVEMPPPPPGAPGMFRCAPDGLMVELFQQAGFKNVSQKNVTSKLASGTAETYWNMMTEVGAPIVAALSKLDEATQQKIKAEVIALVNEKYPQGQVAIDAEARIIYGERI